MTTITNESFLRQVFGPNYARAWVTGFKNDPLAGRHSIWKGGEYRNGGMERIVNPWERNTFVAISVFKEADDGVAHRRKALFDQCHLIMIDDVGTKVSREMLTSVYEIDPTYILETSPGNEQWGLVLKAGDSRAWAVEQLQNILVQRGIADGKDPGMKGVTRYGRLPEGINNKQKYVEKLGHPFKHRMLSWHPEKRFTLEGIANKFGAVLTEPSNLTRTNEVQHDPDKPDLLFDALFTEGLVLNEIPNKPGVFDIICPWVHEHTDHDQSGTAYFTPGSSDGVVTVLHGGFKCHHGSCIERKLHDVRQEMYNRGYKNVYEGTALDIPAMFPEPEVTGEVDNVITRTTGPDSGEVYQPGETADFQYEPITEPDTVENEDTPEPTGIDAYSIKGLLDHEPPPRQWLIENVVPRNKVGVVISPGGVGKSMFMLGLSTALAINEPFIRTWVPPEAFSVLYVAAEEDKDEIHRRLWAEFDKIITESMLLDEREKVQEWRASLESRLYVNACAGTDVQLTKPAEHGQLVHGPMLGDLIELVKQLKPPRLLILDPLSRFNGGDENRNEHMTKLVQMCELIIAKTIDTTVLLAHHANKAASRNNDNSQAASRGGSGLTDGVRWQCQLRTMRLEEAEDYGIEANRAGYYVQLAVTKSNYSAPQEPLWLERGQNGVLYEADNQQFLNTRADENDRFLANVVDFIRRETEHGRADELIKRYFTDYARVDGMLGFPASRLTEILQYGEDNGVLAVEEVTRGKTKAKLYSVAADNAGGNDES